MVIIVYCFLIYLWEKQTNNRKKQIGKTLVKAKKKPCLVMIFRLGKKVRRYLNEIFKTPHWKYILSDNKQLYNLIRKKGIAKGKHKIIVIIYTLIFQKFNKLLSKDVIFFSVILS